MNLVLSDKNLDCFQTSCTDYDFINLSELKISTCVGCFGCWTKTPGKCVIRDDAVRVYPRIAASDHILYISRIRYGGYDTIMKTLLERSIPVQQAFIRLLQGETHHVQRKVVAKKAVVIGYGDILPEEQKIFSRLVERNAKNMNFENYRIIFAEEKEVERIAEIEVNQWKK